MAGALSISNTFQTQTGPIPLSQLDTNFSQLAGVVNNTQSYSNYYVDSSGAANTITVTIPAPTTFAYAAGVQLAVKLSNTNTSASVNINVNTLGNIAVQNFDGSQPAVGQLVAGQILLMMYNGTAFVLTGASSKSASIAPFTATAAGNVTLPAPSSGTALTANGAGGSSFSGYAAKFTAPNTTSQSNGVLILAGTNQSDAALALANPTQTTNYWIFYGDGSLASGNVIPQGIDSFNCGSLYVFNNPVYAGIPQNSQTANYTTVLSDANKHIRMNGTSLTVTIAANSSVPYPVGTAITFFNSSATNLTIAINTDTMVLSGGSSSTGNRTLAVNSTATALKTSATVWVISGSGLT
jgi:hypothetical protein